MDARFDVHDKLAKLRETVQENVLKSEEIGTAIIGHKRALLDLRRSRVRASDVAAINEEISAIDKHIAALKDDVYRLEAGQERLTSSIHDGEENNLEADESLSRATRAYSLEQSQLLSLTATHLERHVIWAESHFMAGEDELASELLLEHVRSRGRGRGTSADGKQSKDEIINNLRADLHKLLNEVETESGYIAQLKRLYPSL
jgi:hypothetical protein